jgi:hypothetical protein
MVINIEKNNPQKRTILNKNNPQKRTILNKNYKKLLSL